ncbi:hypothetical protein ABMA28_017010 [Loxostege sticticalis]|uniref:Uncharacterized protein n=1 Tax=Loxostege sticticalis TaxID=481309 RepID=A0ABD0T6M6_LOXSC
MKSFIVAFCFLACAYALTPVDETGAEVLRSNSDQTPDGSFQYSFETSNGIAAQVEGHVKELGKDELALQVTGSNQFLSPEGEKFELTYVADETGYHPQGAHLPTPPPAEPIPEYIQKALKYIEEHPYEEKKQ